MITAEALEARAFGAPLSPRAILRPWQAAALLCGIGAAVTGVFCLALGQFAAAGALFLLAAASLAAALLLRRPAASDPRCTRYRDPVWARAEWIVSGAAVAVLVVQIAVLAVAPTAFRYEPYPSLTIPPVDLPLLAALALLLAPAAVRP
jgi:hypothetical protein